MVFALLQKLPRALIHDLEVDDQVYSTMYTLTIVVALQVVCPSVRLSVRPSDTGIDSKLMTERSCSLHHRVGHGVLVFLTTTFIPQIQGTFLRMLQTRLGGQNGEKTHHFQSINRYISETIGERKKQKRRGGLVTKWFAGFASDRAFRFSTQSFYWSHVMWESFENAGSQTSETER